MSLSGFSWLRAKWQSFRAWAKNSWLFAAFSLGGLALVLRTLWRNFFRKRMAQDIGEAEHRKEVFEAAVKTEQDAASQLATETRLLNLTRQQIYDRSVELALELEPKPLEPTLSAEDTAARLRGMAAKPEWQRLLDAIDSEQSGSAKSKEADEEV